MKIFLAERDNYDYDETDALVIQAKDIESAEKVTSEYDWGGNYVYDKEDITIKEIDLNDGKSGVILESFNAG